MTIQNGQESRKVAKCDLLDTRCRMYAYINTSRAESTIPLATSNVRLDNYRVLYIYVLLGHSEDARMLCVTQKIQGEEHKVRSNV